ncbi:hypothetical protein LZ32DRAFT_623725 [Colletotrichum eremochloae]|nr:hypothetical protein LZ32DRAFT_623725 [Colletotrichum eremochloae]
MKLHEDVIAYNRDDLELAILDEKVMQATNTLAILHSNASSLLNVALIDQTYDFYPKQSNITNKTVLGDVYNAVRVCNCIFLSQWNLMDSHVTLGSSENITGKTLQTTHDTQLAADVKNYSAMKDRNSHDDIPTEIKFAANSFTVNGLKTSNNVSSTITKANRGDYGLSG